MCINRSINKLYLELKSYKEIRFQAKICVLFFNLFMYKLALMNFLNRIVFNGLSINKHKS